MNLPNKLTITRIVLAIVLIILLCFPFYEIGFEFPSITIRNVSLSCKYIVAGVIFLMASITDLFDGYIARKKGLVTNTGKILDAIADKVLVNSVLIILTSLNEINVLVPVVIVLRDILVDAIRIEAARNGKVVAAIKSGKLKTVSLMIGVTLIFFGNLPFEFIGLRVAEFFLYFAAILSIVSLMQYYSINKKIMFEDKNS